MLSRGPSLTTKFYGRRNRKPTSQDELFDDTDRFIKFIQAKKGASDFGGIMWTVGGAGSGKTCLMCTFQNIFLLSDPERNVSFYKAPESILTAIKLSAPKKIYNRIRIIDKLGEVEPLDIFSMDEGYLTASAKEALQKDKSNFEKSITTLRHKGVFTILNSLDDGILKGYRKKAQFQFFKLLTHGFIDETNIKFLRKHEDIVTALFPEQTLFRTSHHMFITAGMTQGILDLHKSEFCPWYSDEISRSFEGECFDANYRDELRRAEKREEVIKWIMENFGPRLAQSKIADLIEGTLYDEQNDLWYEFKNDLTLMRKIAYSRQDKLTDLEKKRNKILKDSETIFEIPALEANKETELRCAEFFREYYEINLPKYLDMNNQINKKLPEIFYLWVSSHSQKNEIQPEVKLSINTINENIQRYVTGSCKNKPLPHDDLRLCYCYEHYIASETGGVRDGRKSVPDILFHDDEGKIIGPGECKLFYEKPKSVSYYIDEDLKPSHEYCLDNNIRYFPLFFRNPIKWWGNYDLMIPVDCNPPKSTRFPNRITITTAMINEGYLRFQNFDKLEFFNEKNIIE